MKISKWGLWMCADSRPHSMTRKYLIYIFVFFCFICILFMLKIRFFRSMRWFAPKYKWRECSHGSSQKKQRHANRIDRRNIVTTNVVQKRRKSTNKENNKAGMKKLEKDRNYEFSSRASYNFFIRYFTFIHALFVRLCWFVVFILCR